MIVIEACRREGGVEIEARGHAGYSAAGTDIVCAGVSALLYGLLAYVEHAAEAASPGERPWVEWQEGAGWLRLRTGRFPGQADRLAAEVALAGLRKIQEAYPGYVTLRDRITIRKHSRP